MDLVVDEDVEEDAVVVVMREAVICWIRTRAWREILKVDVCVMRKRVSM